MNRETFAWGKCTEILHAYLGILAPRYMIVSYNLYTLSAYVVSTKAALFLFRFLFVSLHPTQFLTLYLLNRPYLMFSQFSTEHSISVSVNLTLQNESKKLSSLD